jgi:hypothetical protein
MTDDRASLTAFLVAPIVPAISFALFSPGLGGGFGSGIPYLAGLSAIGYVYSLFAVGLLGFPAFLILSKYGLVGLTASITSGTLLGLLVAFVLVPQPSYSSSLDWLWQIRGVALVGGLTGLAFWAVRMLCLRVSGGR